MIFMDTWKMYKDRNSNRRHTNKDCRIMRYVVLVAAVGV
jgi:hypothetical protein